MSRNRRFRRQLRLEQLGYRDYRDYLRSAHWHDLKRRYRESDRPQECICGEVERVQLHHLTYERIGHEELTDLTPLCARCHAMIHELERRGEIGLDFAGFVNAQRAAQYAAQRMPSEAPDPPPLKDQIRLVCDSLRATALRMCDRGEDPTAFLSEIRESVREASLNPSAQTG